MPESKADVVDLSAPEVLTRLGEETGKWKGWGINLRRLFHVFHHFSEIQLKGLIDRTYTIVRVETAKVTRSLDRLVYKTTITIPAVDEFVTREFYYRHKIGLSMSRRFQENILAKASERISRSEHKLDILELSAKGVYTSALLRELGSLKVVSVDDYLASMKTRIERCWPGQVSLLVVRDNNASGVYNIEFVDVGDSIVIALCYFDHETLDECAEWCLDFRRIDELGYLEVGSSISAPHST